MQRGPFPTMSNTYLSPGRLEDILVLIQILGYDLRCQINSETIIKEGFKPHSANSWAEVAEFHPEFFRVSGEGQALSLVIRHASKDELGDRPPVKDMVKPLMDIAINIHDRHVKCHEQRLQFWSLVFAGFATLASFITVLLNCILKKT
jgi:hypothetical protein